MRPHSKENGIPFTERLSLLGKTVAFLFVTRTLGVLHGLSISRNVRRGSISDLAPHLNQVRSSPDSGHKPATAACPKSAMNGPDVSLFDKFIGTQKERLIGGMNDAWEPHSGSAASSLNVGKRPEKNSNGSSCNKRPASETQGSSQQIGEAAQ
jgi:hypothetical protein